MICRTLLLASMAIISNATTHRAVEVGHCRDVHESDVAECIEREQLIIDVWDDNERSFEEGIRGLKTLSIAQTGAPPIFKIEWCNDYEGSWYEQAMTARWNPVQ